ncbi:hypothetical protein RQP54_17970 [Curvibacter sp. APW13]|uniref:hypothetical protein n=1 Tax=Curvibacter sp. APW13 TaxID=3077236 RepID=UPI0028DE90D0|nr:hypothetical protein [Curvibacter sp. APW13]MDT8992765.1 hypothetical protein [Curvibacter sp. APW13]
MTTVIEIGTVPSNEMSPTGDIQAAIVAGVFMRQLNRQVPLQGGMRYVVMQRMAKKPWLSVVLTSNVNSWESADITMEKASAASMVEKWDEEALLELQQHGFAPSPAQTAIAA